MAERLLVTGASSAVGEFLLPRLAAAGHAVVALSRSPRRAVAPVVWQLGDLADENPALPWKEIDVLIHLAPIWLLPDWLERIPAPTAIKQVIA